MDNKKDKVPPFNQVNASNEVASSLMTKYKAIFVNKLTKQDLKELQFYFKNQFDENRTLNKEYKLKFESKLRQYFHEEVLKREIVSIEALLSSLKPEDLEK